MKATLVVSTLLGLGAAHVMPRAMAGGYASDKTSATAVSVTTKAPLTTGVSYPHGGGDYGSGDDGDDDDGDDDEYCDDEGDDDDEDDCGDDGCDDDEDDEDCGDWGCDHGGHGGHSSGAWSSDHSSPTWSHIPVPEITSTVTATSVYTVTACPSTVTNCPVGHVTTEVVTAYTTYCPKPTADITQYSTIMVTVTDCPKTVSNCPARTSATVETCVYTPVPTAQTVYATVTLPTCPGGAGSCYETHSEVKTSWYYAPGTSSAVSPVKTTPAGYSAPAGTGSPVKPTTVATTYAYAPTGTGGAPVPTRTAQGSSPTYPVTAGVGKVGFSAAAIVAAAAAFVL